MRQRAAAVIVGITLTLALGSIPRAAIAAQADRVESQLEFGVDMAKRGLWNEALFRFKRALVSRPGDAAILNNIAVSYEALGLFEQALEAYREALAAGPGNRDLKSNYSRFLEFYQSFKPATEEAGDAAAGPEEAPAEGAATPEGSR